MSTHNSDRLGPAPLKSFNAFSLPKLKTGVAKKFAQRVENTLTSSGSLEDRENKDKAANQPSCLEEAASPSAGRAADEVPTSKPTSIRKSKRQARSRPSEVTVYYDAVQSPDDANTVVKQKPRNARAGRGQSKQLTSNVNHSGALDTAAEAVALPQGRDAEVQAVDADSKAPGHTASGHLQQPSSAAGISSSADARDIFAEDKPTGFAAVANTCRKDKNPEKSPVGQFLEAGVHQEAVEQQQQDTRAADGFRGGQEIFKYMQQLAEDAAGLLPQDDDQEQKKRGRGRAKKDLRLVDALHQSWNGKSYYERLQELTRHEVEQEEQPAVVLGPEYKPLRLSAAAAADDSRDDCRKPSSHSQQSQDASHAANTRKRRTAQPGSRQSAADSDAEMESPGVDAAAAVAIAPVDTTVAAGGPSKRRATQSTAAGRAAAAAPKASKAATNASGPTANKSRRTTNIGSSAAATATAGASRSPFVNCTAAGNRPPSSRSTASLACDFTPAAPATAGGVLAERPPWSVGGPATGTAVVTGGTAGTGAAKADRGAIQKLQTALDAKTDELSVVKDQLKDLQDVVAKLRAEQKAHPKALSQLEKQKQTWEKKVEAAERRQAVLERENEALQEKLAKQEAEKAALQEQLSKSDKEGKALRAKLKQMTAKLEKCQGIGLKLQEMGATLAAEAQPVWME